MLQLYAESTANVELKLPVLPGRSAQTHPLCWPPALYKLKGL